MIRRAFLHSVLGFFGLQTIKPYKRVRIFRAEIGGNQKNQPAMEGDVDFVEVNPQDVKAGDKVICIGILDGTLDRLEYFQAASPWEPGDCPRSRENGQIKKHNRFTDLITLCTGWTRVTPRWPASCDRPA